MKVISKCKFIVGSSKINGSGIKNTAGIVLCNRVEPKIVQGKCYFVEFLLTYRVGLQIEKPNLGILQLEILNGYTRKFIFNQVIQVKLIDSLTTGRNLFLCRPVFDFGVG